MAKSLKYGVVLDEHGALKQDEPVFVIAASDPLAMATIAMYGHLAEAAGQAEAELAGIEAAQKVIYDYCVANKVGRIARLAELAEAEADEKTIIIQANPDTTARVIHPKVEGVEADILKAMVALEDEQDGPSNAAWIGKKVGLTGVNVSPRLTKLRKHGLVTRKAQARGPHWWELTPRGRAVAG